MPRVPDEVLVEVLERGPATARRLAERMTATGSLAHGTTAKEVGQLCRRHPLIDVVDQGGISGHAYVYGLQEVPLHA